MGNKKDKDICFAMIDDVFVGTFVKRNSDYFIKTKDGSALFGEISESNKNFRERMTENGVKFGKKFESMNEFMPPHVIWVTSETFLYSEKEKEVIIDFSSERKGYTKMHLKTHVVYIDNENESFIQKFLLSLENVKLVFILTKDMIPMFSKDGEGRCFSEIRALTI